MKMAVVSDCDSYWFEGVEHSNPAVSRTAGYDTAAVDLTLAASMIDKHHYYSAAVGHTPNTGNTNYRYHNHLGCNSNCQVVPLVHTHNAD